VKNKKIEKSRVYRESRRSNRGRREEKDRIEIIFDSDPLGLDGPANCAFILASG